MDTKEFVERSEIRQVYVRTNISSIKFLTSRQKLWVRLGNYGSGPLKWGEELADKMSIRERKGSLISAKNKGGSFCQQHRGRQRSREKATGRLFLMRLPLLWSQAPGQSVGVHVAHLASPGCPNRSI